MKLTEIIADVQIKHIVGEDSIYISDIQSDSRNLKEGSLFVAVRGITVDGHDYIEQAIQKGVSAILCEEIPDVLKDTCTFVVAEDSSKALGIVLDTWYDHPSRKLNLIGITGTNGKTTVATLLYELFLKLGYKTGLISTVCNCIHTEKISTNYTTPDPITLQHLLAQMVEAGCEYVFMEVSSHSVVQKRISGLTFKGGVFTNLTRDHLDFHKTVQNYLQAKKAFFDYLPENAFVLTNLDDKSGLVMLQNTAAKKWTYSLQTLADFKAKVLETHFDGTELVINGTELSVHFMGRFNVYNLLAVYGTAIALEQSPEEVLVALSMLHPVSGRFETIRSASGFTVVVDYAHTPDALNNVLSSIREVLNGKAEVITVVGAGGNRDKGKRPLMAKEACKQSERVILTSDNPRFEKPEAIIEDMVSGLEGSDLKRTICITDRKEAIKAAIHMAQKGDIVLIAGKGHEDYQEIKGVKYPFSDKEIVQSLIEVV